MVCTDHEQIFEENKQIRRCREKCVKSVNLLPSITGWGIKADRMSCHGGDGVCCILAQWVDNIELDVKSSIRVDNMYSICFMTVSSAGIF